MANAKYFLKRFAIRLTTWIYIGFGRMRNRHRQRLEIPLHYGNVRRCGIYINVSCIFSYTRSSDYGMRIYRRSWKPNGYGQSF